jgi:hypothetical protein
MAIIPTRLLLSPKLKKGTVMNKITAISVSVLLAFSASAALAMNGQADRIHEARSYPAKTVDTVANVDVLPRK